MARNGDTKKRRVVVGRGQVDISAHVGEVYEYPHDGDEAGVGGFFLAVLFVVTAVGLQRKTPSCRCL